MSKAEIVPLIVDRSRLENASDFTSWLRKLSIYDRKDIAEAFCTTLRSADHKVLEFSLQLLRRYFKDFKSLKPVVVELILHDSVAVSRLALETFTDMRLTDPAVKDLARNILKKGKSEVLCIEAARYLLICHHDPDALAWLENRVDEGFHDSQGMVHLSEAKYPIQEIRNYQYDSVKQLLSLSPSYSQELLATMRENRLIDLELVASHNNQVVGQIGFVELEIDADVQITAALMLPILVHPDHRSKVIGTRLFFEGVHLCSLFEISLVFTTGAAAWCSFAENLGDAIAKHRIESEPKLTRWILLQDYSGFPSISGKAVLPQPLIASLGNWICE
jgi:predicted N-acetyltransferase YhbS